MVDLATSRMVGVFIIGFFSPFILVLVGWFVTSLASWIKSPKRDKIIQFRTWRIKRLEAKADKLRRNYNRAGL